MTATSSPCRSRRAARSARAEASGSLGSSTSWVRSTLDASMPADGHHEAVVGLHDPGRPAAGDHPGGLGGQHLLARGGPRRARRPARRPAAPPPSTRSCWSPRARRRRAARARRARSARPGRRPAVDVADAVAPAGSPALMPSSSAARDHRRRRRLVGHPQRHRPDRRRPAPPCPRPRCRPASRRACRRRAGRRTARRRPAARALDADARPGTCRPCPRTGAPPMIGETPDHRRGAARPAPRAARARPGSARCSPPGCSARPAPRRPSASASSTPGAGLAVSAPTKTNRCGRHLAPVAYPPLLEVDRPLPVDGRPPRGSPGGRRWRAAGVRPAASARTAPR